jgi:1-pyrroline-5-carboxylate dehydrogenase
LELGGKNPAIVSRNANLEDAATGIVRSAFGLQGQKCSAASRVLVEEPVYEELLGKLKMKTESLIIGDPTERTTYWGPVINQSSYNDFKNFTEEINQAGGNFLTGGHVKTGGIFDKGYYCEPTFVTDLPYEHRLWQYEMFLPITTIGKVNNLDEAMKIANDVNYGLTAGFYGSAREVEWFYDNIEAGVTYANRPQGATTGAWPGYQPFGGWKGSGSSGKNGGGYYYVQLYMHEQIRTLVKPAKANGKASSKGTSAKKAVKKAVKKVAKKVRK